MLLGIEVKYLWSDQDLMSIEMKVSNGSFAGASKILVGLSELMQLANTLAGFPAHGSDARHVSLGFPDDGPAGGAVLDLHCIGRAAHGVLKLEIKHDVWEPYGAQFSRVFFDIEAPAIDRFCEELRQFGPNGLDRAVLTASAPRE